MRETIAKPAAMPGSNVAIQFFAAMTVASGAVAKITVRGRRAIPVNR